MRFVAAAVAALTIVLMTVFWDAAPATGAQAPDAKTIFRFDTFGDEQLWTKELRLHEAIENVSPATALKVGLKVDVEALPPSLISALRAGKVDLDDPAVTIRLLELNAVVGVVGRVIGNGKLHSIGITCALCHSTVDDSFASGIGRRLDGWSNRDLNVGAIVALSPALDEATKKVLNGWGPGKYDPRRQIFDGRNIVPLNQPSLPVVIPSIFGSRVSASKPSPETDRSRTGTPMWAYRSATKRYRTTPLRALQHPPYFHDGSAADLRAVVNHYDRVLELKLTEPQKSDLIEFLGTL